MTNRRHVSPGEPARRNMTAEHYNDAIPTTIRSTLIPEERHIHREEVIYCVVDDDSPTVPSNERYVTVAVLDLKRRADLDVIVPRTSADTGLIDDCNWGIAQEGVLAKDTCLTCIGGITRAKVNVIDSAHKYVTWDEVAGELISHPFGGKAYLIQPGFAGAGDHQDIALIYISKCSDLEIIPIMRFFADTKIVNREFDATVDIINANVPNPNNGGLPFQQGDSVRIHDPGQLFGEIEIDGTGFAYYRRTKLPSSPLSFENRWEVEECSLPINRITGKIEACLLYSDVSATVKFGSVNGFPDFLLSSWPNVDFPPEAVINAADDYEILALNPCKLDAGENSTVTIRRHSDLQPSDPRNLVSPKPVSSTDEAWEIVKVFEQIARWAKFEKSGSFNLVAFWEGSNPAPCEADSLTCAFDCSCLEDGDEIIGFYDPAANSYIGISTASALLGPPDTITTLVGALSFDGDTCSITYSTQSIKAFACGSTPSPGSAALPLALINSLDNLYVTGTEICAITTSYTVVACSAGGVNLFCVDICPILCLCEEIYSIPDVCTPPPPPDCDCCDCLFITGVTSIEITWDGETHGTTDITRLPLIGPCVWLAIFDDALGGAPKSWTLHLECIGSVSTWSATGAWMGLNNQPLAMTLIGPGDCTGTDALVGAAEPYLDATGIIETDGDLVPCLPPGCCEEWSGDERVIRFEGSKFNQFFFTFIESSPPESDGECSASFTVMAHLEDIDNDDVCDIECKCTLIIVDDFPFAGWTACAWKIELPTCPEVPAWLGDTITLINDCLFAECIDAGSDCDNDWQEFHFEIEDPDVSVDQSSCGVEGT